MKIAVVGVEVDAIDDYRGQQLNVALGVGKFRSYAPPEILFQITDW